MRPASRCLTAYGFEECNVVRLASLLDFVAVRFRAFAADRTEWPDLLAGLAAIASTGCGAVWTLAAGRHARRAVGRLHCAAVATRSLRFAVAADPHAAAPPIDVHRAATALAGQTRTSPAGGPAPRVASFGGCTAAPRRGGSHAHPRVNASCDCLAAVCCGHLDLAPAGPLHAGSDFDVLARGGTCDLFSCRSLLLARRDCTLSAHPPRDPLDRAALFIAGRTAGHGPFGPAYFFRPGPVFALSCGSANLEHRAPRRSGGGRRADVGLRFAHLLGCSFARGR